MANSRLFINAGRRLFPKDEHPLGEKTEVLSYQRSLSFLLGVFAFSSQLFPLDDSFRIL
jgi:hypothetical protein